MTVKKRRKLKTPVIIIAILAVIGSFVAGGFFLLNLFSTPFPDELLVVNNETKNGGQHKVYKEKINTAFIVQHYPKSGISTLDTWVNEETDRVREEIKEKKLKDVIITGDEALHQVKQDYEYYETQNRYISVTLEMYFDNELYHQKSRVYDKDSNDFIDCKDFFKPMARRILTTKARQSLDRKETPRGEFINNVNFENDTMNFKIKDTTLTAIFPYGNIDVDLAANTDYLAADFGSIKATNNTLPSTYVDSGVDGSKKLVAFTFDDGPHGEFTKVVMDTIESYNGHATFFVLGHRIEGREEILREILNRGHQLANHSYNHPNLTKISVEAAQEQLNKTEALLQKATGYTGPYYVRPPYGAMTESLRKTLDKVFINWTVDTEDWLSKDVDTICKKTVKDAYNGSIILMHDIYESTAEAFKCVAKTMHDEGYEFVTVTELLESRGYDVETGNLYYQAKP